MKLIPHQQKKMWLMRIEEGWNQPSRTDHYLMALTNTVYGIFGEGKSSLDPFKLRFNNDMTKNDPTIKSKAYVDQRKAEAKAAAQSGVIVRGDRPEGKPRK